MKSQTTVLGFIGSFLSLLGFQAALAQEFPTKPVIPVISVGADGSHDLTARAVTSVANDYSGQPIPKSTPRKDFQEIVVPLGINASYDEPIPIGQPVYSCRRKLNLGFFD